MQTAFEKDPEKEYGYFPGIRDQYILAAAQWIMWNGQNLFKQLVHIDGEDDSVNGRPSCSTGPLYNGDSKLSLDRWQFWTNGFSSTVEDDSLNEECRTISKVVRLMDSIRESMMLE